MTRWVFLLGLFGTTLSAQQGASRGDLALAYCEVESALDEAGELSPERLVVVNRAFDQATLAFFSGSTARALGGLRTLALELRGREAAEIAGLPLRVQLEPNVWVQGEALPRISVLKARSAALSMRLRPVGHAAAGPVFVIPAGEVSATLPVERLGVGCYEVCASGLPLARFTVCREDPAVVKRALTSRLEAAPASRARDLVEARLTLLTRTPNPQDTTQVFSDLPVLNETLRREVAQLEAGENPFRERAGSCWRPYLVGKQTVGLRVYAPTTVDLAQPLPLVIAFHGAGGDENMWAWGYGRGVLERLAESEGFLLACPRTESLVRVPGAAVTALLEELSRDYTIDRRRIYALGHSLGVMALDGVRRQCGDLFAAALCFSGVPRGKRLRETRALLGTIDPLVPARMARAREGFEVKILEGYGHTLGVGPQLPAEVRRLLGRPGWF